MFEISYQSVRSQGRKVSNTLSGFHVSLSCMLWVFFKGVMKNVLNILSCKWLQSEKMSWFSLKSTGIVSNFYKNSQNVNVNIYMIQALRVSF